jgi:hypothetical protein
MRYPAALGKGRRGIDPPMEAVALFGLFTVIAMLVTHALEERSHWMILGFAGACALASAYAVLQSAWPFGIVEGIWGALELRRWRAVRAQTQAA